MMETEFAQDWTLENLKQVLEGQLLEVRGGSGRTFPSISTDSRNLKAGELFVAIRGAQRDGHDYALQAAENGAGALILEHTVGARCPEIIVRNSIEAYGMLARAWRSQYAIPVICVVGANGKTTTTQMIGSILKAAVGEDHAICTEGNFNNEIGVPRTLLRLNPSTRIAVVEAGMNHPGEMARLAHWIRPTVVVVTNAQREHQAYIDGPEGSARENGLAIVALSAKAKAVLPLLDPCLRIWKDYARARGCSILTYALGDEKAEVNAHEEGEAMRIALAGHSIGVRLALQGRHAMHDAAAAAAASLAAGVDAASIERGLAAFSPLAGRGLVHRLAHGVSLVDESYNANPDSMRSAIDVLARMPSPRILVAGEMGELGSTSEACHTEIGLYAKARGIEQLLATGETMPLAVEAFGEGAQYFKTREALEEAVLKAATMPCTLLVKGSHFVGLEKVVQAVLARYDASEKPKE